MRSMISLRLGYKLLRRDWSSGELRILFSALLIGVISTTTINFFTERVRLAMLNSASDVIGGDLVLESSNEIPLSWVKHATDLGLETASTVIFSSMVSLGNEFKLSSVKAVGSSYPLRGELLLSNAGGQSAQARSAPLPGTAWADERLLKSLDLSIGDSVVVGDANLRVSHELVFEPDRGNGFYDLQPRLMMHSSDLAVANVIQVGSRAQFKQLFVGDSGDLAVFQQWLQSRLTAHQTIVTAREGRPSMRNSLERAEKFLNLSSFIAVLLACVAIAIATQQYAKKHFDTTALLRCFGASEKQVLGIFLVQLILLGLITSVLGSIIGFFGQFGFIHLLQELLPQKLPHSGPKPIVLGFATAFCMLLGFALPPIFKLRGVTPLRTLRRDLEPVGLSSWFFYGMAVIFIVALLMLYTQAVLLSIIIVIGCVIGFSLFALISWQLFTLMKQVTSGSGFIVRNSLKNLRRHQGLTVSQITSFGLTFLAIALIALIRTDLIMSWQQQLPDTVPNHFATNITANDVSEFQRFMHRNGVDNVTLYPMTRGRLTAINGTPVQQVVSKEAQVRGTTRRELNMTWSDTLQLDNKLSSGSWWSDLKDTEEKQVSVEVELAERLGIQVGDSLSFTVTGEEFSARVTSLRVVRWESFRPNFYMVFRPGDMDEFAATYMTGFYLNDEQINLVQTLVQNFSSMTLFEVNVLIKQVRNILTQVTLAIEGIFLLVVFSGVIVLFAAVQASLSERLYEGALWRALGASRGEILQMQAIEFLIIGFLAGLLATISFEVIGFLLYVKVFNLVYEVKWFLWPITWGATTIVITACGIIGTRSVVRTSPLLALRGQ